MVGDRIIPLGRYMVVIHPDGKRQLLSEGQPWMVPQETTVVWELIDKILELTHANPVI